MSARLLVAMQSLPQENPPYASAVHEFAGGGSISVLRIRYLANAQEMGKGGLMVVEAAVLAAVSASSLSGVPMHPGIHRREVGPGRALRSDLR